ncbi:unnamed protein product [Rotaria sp. Silwood2]|nr:unnamed protein product [Rotaria sp. Silwood2]CAF2528471.1 unnamed protein product [Rotaria sp. Silwood2]CAF2786192.1 unnamed protein product [Rotaria sp. Silwood2]CAF2938884.1 unnamed protein product [Rotaria sp. Silwood2]CAF3896411.1 unnamed protein product [Rotaria sp. Silwood2]
MVVLTTDVIVALSVVAAVIVLILLIILIVCLCRQCDRCARWSRQKAVTREETVRDKEFAESRRQFDEIRQQHNEVRDQLRVKYNLNDGDSRTVIVS